MMHVFQNLVTNAIKFRNNKNLRIYISGKIEEDHWIFGVSDNGIGIDPHLPQTYIRSIPKASSKEMNMMVLEWVCSSQKK
jgi:light-regulated signal transduction histidine kinase (bacteriophytochrome)